MSRSGDEIIQRVALATMQGRACWKIRRLTITHYDACDCTLTRTTRTTRTPRTSCTFVIRSLRSRQVLCTALGTLRASKGLAISNLSSIRQRPLMNIWR
jgi:hypothetical protein